MYVKIYSIIIKVTYKKMYYIKNKFLSVFHEKFVLFTKILKGFETTY